MGFSKEEFDIMVYELLYKEPISFDMLCYIADKTLRKRVDYWCYEENCLRGRGYEDDIMQEIHLRLMKTTINYFLLKNTSDGVVNNNPTGFKNWLITVGENIKKDFANKVRRIDFSTEDIDDQSIVSETDFLVSYDTCERQIQLKEAFSIVLSADAGIYKILTWLAQFIFVLNLDITKIQSNEQILKTFENKTLYEMFYILEESVAQIPWLEISSSQRRKILCELAKKHSNSTIYGDMNFKDFFMKVNGEKSGKKSISDWVNRMNSLIKRKTGKSFDFYKQKDEEWF